MPQRWLLLPILLALPLGPVAAADDGPDGAPAGAPPATDATAAPHERAASAALAAVRAGDDRALQALARSDAPDPWLVADELLRRGERAAAEAFARAAPRIDTQALPNYVASRHDVREDPLRRALHVAAEAALASSRHQLALDTLGERPAAAPECVLDVQLLMTGGIALAALGRPDEAAGVFTAVGDGAERLGWLARAMDGYSQAALNARQAGSVAAELGAWERRAALGERRALLADAAKTLFWIADLHKTRRDIPAALAALQRALGLCESLGDRLYVAKALGSMGRIHDQHGARAEALALYERALAALEDGGESALGAALLNLIGNVRLGRGEHVAAVAAYERALATQAGLGDRAGAAATRSSMGIAYLELRASSEALATFELALAEFRSLGDQAGVAATLGNIGIAYAARGDFAKALSTYERALAMKLELGEQAAAAQTLANIGNVYARLGDGARALATHERALAIQATLGDESASSNTLGSIASDYEALGELEQALATHERALAIMERLGDEAGAATTLLNMGNVRVHQGDVSKALELHQRAHAALAALGLRSSAARARHIIGMDHQRAGDYAAALVEFQLALSEMEELEDRTGVVATLCNLGIIHNALGQFDQGLDFARRAAPLVGALTQGLGDGESVEAREGFARVYEVGARAAAAQGNAAELAYFLESGRAGALLEGLQALKELASTVIDPRLRTAELEARAEETLATRNLRAARAADDRPAVRLQRKALDAARQRVSEVVARIQREGKAAAGILYPVPATLDELRASLQTGDALVLYGLLTAAAPTHEPQPSAPPAVALVVTPDATRIATLAAPTEIAGAVAAARFDERGADPTQALAQLARYLVQPLQLPPATKRVFVSPAGPLSLVPFAALLPDVTVVHVDSGTTYRALLATPSRQGQGVLALGDPDYQTPGDASARELYRGRGRILRPLPGSREEAKAVGSVTLLGGEATEAGLRAALARQPSWRALHLACHGLVDPKRPALSSLALTPTADEDGFLSALDVLRMKIPADLVVLSACETGKGKVVGTEGIVGLTRAFMLAGAPRVICSLWKVDDEATRALMVKFYECWLGSTPSAPGAAPGEPRGMSTAEALKAAQEFVRAQEKWRHPFYWAAWVLWGLAN